jgi:RNA polymerase sigma factor for flagellar operon FliA
LKARSFNFKPYYQNQISAVSSWDASSDREEIILKHISMIKYIAHRLALRLPPHISAEDLYSAGFIGLMDALNKFDPRKKTQFKTYAEFRIKGAMLDELRSQDCVSRSVRQKATALEKATETLQKKNGRRVEDEEVAQELGLSLDDYYDLVNETKKVCFPDERKDWAENSFFPGEKLTDQSIDKLENNPFHLLSQGEAKKIITQAIEELPIKERTVISLYYYQDLTLQEIAEILGFTESRICQIRGKTILKLKSKIDSYFNGGKNTFKSFNKIQGLGKTYS